MPIRRQKNAASPLNSRRSYPLIDFVIFSFRHRRMAVDNDLAAQASGIVVVDDAAGLEVGVNSDTADILKTALLHIFADSFRQAVADRNRSLGMTLIENRFSAGEAPEVVAQASEFVAQFLTAAGIVDDSLYLPERADHTFGI